MKRILLSALLALCLVQTSAYAAEAETETEADSNSGLSITALVDGMEIRAAEVEGEKYLFLPGNADAAALTLRVQRNGSAVTAITVAGAHGAAGNGTTIDLYEIAAHEGDNRFSFAVEADGVTEQVTVMVGRGLRSMYLWSDSADKDRTWVDTSKKNHATGTMQLVDEAGDTVYSGALGQIKARGNSTFRYAKKSYQIKLEKKADLLGNGEKVKTWVLLAGYGDATMQHDKLFKNLALELGMEQTASCDWVNLYYDGEYRGVYLLSEKNSVNSTSVDIEDLEEQYERKNPSYGSNMTTAEGTNQYGNTYVYTVGLAEPEDISGGWLIERNLESIDEANGFYATRGGAFNIKSPEWAGKAAVEYISSYYQEFEDAVFATDENGNYTGINPVTHKSFDEYVDLDSLVKVFLLQELALNPDGFISSFYFYKDAGEIMYAGPIWDQELTLGTGWEIYIPYTVVDYHYLQAGLIKIPAFRAALEEYFTMTFLPAAETWLGEEGTIAQNYARLRDSAAMNYTLWPYVRIGRPTNSGHLWAEGTGFAGVTKDMSLWVEKRLRVLEKLYFNADYAPAYGDVDAADPAYRALCFAAGRGLMQGTGDGNFAPERTVDFGTLCTVLARLGGVDTTPAAGESWQTPGMKWAAEQGIYSGGADAAVSREQLICALWQMAGEADADADLTQFADAHEINESCKTAMAWAVESGMLRGDDAGKLHPGKSVTRAELAQILFDFCNDFGTGTDEEEII